MPRRAWLFAVVLAVIVAAEPAAARSPRLFASCSQLVRYARSELAVSHGRPEPTVAPTAMGVPAPGAPTAGTPTQGASTPTYSTTNNQEPGIDEPDVVKTDGSTIFAVSQNTLYAVDVDGSSLRFAGSLNLGSNGYGAQLLLRGSRLIVISGGGVPLLAGGGPARPGGAAIAPAPYYYGAQTVVTEVDVHDPAAMRVTRTMTVDGAFVDARQNGSTARLVISSTPRAIYYPGLLGQPAGWVPAMRFHSLLTRRRYTRQVAACRTIRQPTQFSGLSMLTILTIDLDRGLYATDSQALMADARVVYGSQHNLYVATERWIDPSTPVDRLPSSQTTVIDQFDATSPNHTTFLASGEVPGYVLNQFSLSEYQGHLRVATTSRPIWWSAEPPRTLSQSYVTVLGSSGGQLERLGQVSGLGAGQQIYSVRFIDASGYVVTFRQVDPLYTIDLSSPTAPRVTGKLELDGYSSYLHPVGPGLLLGIGQDVGAHNEPAGSQLELFDVSDAGAPKLLARNSLGGGSYSQAQYDHHAFLFWPPTKLAVLPVQIYPVSTGPGGATVSGASASDFVGAIGFHIGDAAIAEVGRIAHDPVNGYSPPIRRSIVIGNELLTESDAGVMASNLSTLARQAFVSFPQQPTPGPVAAQRKRPASAAPRRRPLRP